jgi:prepilin-type N-terminal cleavage/methylation domain-containing protein
MTTRGFTLAELLIALAILGIIATFTIPKILENQQASSYRAIAKEVASMITSGYSEYKRTNQVTAGFVPSDLMPYFNYVRVDTASSIDDTPGYGLQSCSNANKCIILHTGAAILFWDGSPMGGTTSTDKVYFDVDPDPTDNTTSTSGPKKSVAFVLYYNGRITSVAGDSGDPNDDPNWFGWD